VSEHRPGRVSVVSWTPHHRAAELARALGGTLVEPKPSSRAWPAPLRYVLQALQTLFHIGRRRPRHVLFTNPPFVTGLVLVTARIAWRKGRVWADTHSGAFNDPRWTRFSRFNEWVMRRCEGVIVTNEHLAQIARERGARPVIVNSPSLMLKERTPAEAPYLVATLGFQFDEPIDELKAALGLRPEVRARLTGAAPPDVRADAPPNCLFTGFLPRADYERLLAGARGVVCLTTREHTMQMGAYEAMEYGLPLLLSGTRVLRDFFPKGVVFAESHEPDVLAERLSRLWNDHERLSEEAIEAREILLERVGLEIRELRRLLAL
jgi:glycosyltransferase involved in cell wall biosynthesis